MATPRPQISITRSRTDQLAAAVKLSELLWKLNCKHAFIGGFAWALLGSARPTEINVLIEAKQMNIMDIRDKLSELNKQFAMAGIKLFYVKGLIGDLRDDDLVRASRDNVLIETLQAGALGLPTAAEPVYPVRQESGQDICILHPSILILTKMKRWKSNYESDRPQTVAKTQSDQADLHYLIYWLEDNKMTIEFDLYKGKEKNDLLEYVRHYKNKFCENTRLMQAMEKLIKPEDWELL